MNLKSLLYIPFLAAICALLLSCSSEDNDFSEVDTSYVSELCVVKGSEPAYLLSDKNMVLNPVSSEVMSGFKESDRVLVTYHLMDAGQSAANNKSYQIKILDIQNVPVLDIIDRSELNVNIDDPIWLLSKPWIGGGFINFEFGFGHSSLNIKHGIYMVYDKFEVINGKKLIYLQFGHNAKSDPPKTESPAFTSVKMSRINDFYIADSIIITVNEGTKISSYHLSAK